MLSRQVMGNGVDYSYIIDIRLNKQLRNKSAVLQSLLCCVNNRVGYKSDLKGFIGFSFSSSPIVLNCFSTELGLNSSGFKANEYLIYMISTLPLAPCKSGRVFTSRQFSEVNSPVVNHLGQMAEVIYVHRRVTYSVVYLNHKTFSSTRTDILLYPYFIRQNYSSKMLKALSQLTSSYKQVRSNANCK